MTERHITNPRDRLTRKYKLLHAQLAAEVAADRTPEPSKQDRKLAASRDFRQHG